MTGGASNQSDESIPLIQRGTLRSSAYMSDAEAFDFVDIQESQCLKPVKTNTLELDSNECTYNSGIANAGANEHVIFEYTQRGTDVPSKQNPSIIVPIMKKNDTDVIRRGYEEQRRSKRTNAVEPRRKRLVHEIMESLPRRKLSGIVQIVMQAGAGQIVEGDLIFDLYSMDQKVIQELESFVQSSSQPTTDVTNSSMRPQRKSRRSQSTESLSESSSESSHECHRDYHAENTHPTTSENLKSGKSTTHTTPNIRATKHRQESLFTEQQRNAIFSTNEILWVSRESEASEDDEVDVDA